MSERLPLHSAEPALSRATRRSAQAAAEPSENRRVFALTLPIAAALSITTLSSLVETALLGRIDRVSLAAVGLAFYALTFSIAVPTGFAVGVQALTARALAGSDRNGALHVLAAGVRLAWVLGPMFSVVLYAAAPAIFAAMTPDAAVAAAAVEYFRVRCLALPFVFINVVHRGYWTGSDQAGVLLRTVVLMQAVNVVLSWALIFGKLGLPALGIRGSALGAAVASAFAALELTRSLQASTGHLLWFGRSVPDGTTASLVKASVPAGLRDLCIVAVIPALLAVVSRLGTVSSAAASVLISIVVAFSMPMTAFAMTATTLIGAALGQGDRDGAYRWGWATARMALLTHAALGLLLVCGPELVLRLFTSDPAVIETARVPVIAIGLTLGVEAISIVFVIGMIAAGDTRGAVFSVFLQWLLVLPATFWIGVKLGYGLSGAWIASSALKTVGAAVLIWLWSRRRFDVKQGVLQPAR